MPRKLKVFRTPIGFHDAYVAAPSRKAALEAWGAGGNLFARGTAEEVTDPKLTAEPLRHPGEVIRVSREIDPVFDHVPHEIRKHHIHPQAGMASKQVRNQRQDVQATEGARRGYPQEP